MSAPARRLCECGRYNWLTTTATLHASAPLRFLHSSPRPQQQQQPAPPPALGHAWQQIQARRQRATANRKQQQAAATQQNVRADQPPAAAARTQQKHAAEFRQSAPHSSNSTPTLSPQPDRNAAATPDDTLQHVPGQYIQHHSPQRRRSATQQDDQLSPLEESLRPSDYYRHFLLTVHPDLFASDTTKKVRVTVPDTQHNQLNPQLPRRYTTRDETMQSIREHNEQQLSMLNSIMDYQKQYTLYESSGEQQLLSQLKPPANNQSLSFFCRIPNPKHPNKHFIRLINTTFTLPKLPTMLVSDNNGSNIPPPIVVDTIEHTVLRLLKRARIDIAERLHSHWSALWRENRIRFNLESADKQSQHSSVYGNALFGGWEGATGYKSRDAMFKEAFRDHPSSVIPANSKHDVAGRFNASEWASTRPRYTMVSTMAEADLIEFDPRLLTTQRLAALNTLKEAVRQHYTKLRCSDWMGVGICFVPAADEESHLGEQAQAQQEGWNAQSGENEDGLLSLVLKSSTETYSDSEWSFARRPGWFLIPWSFDINQMVAFTEMFIEATGGDTTQQLIEEDKLNSKQRLAASDDS